MDPNANLKEMLELAKRMITDYNDCEGNGVDQDDAAHLADLVEALDGWLSNGGFLPARWDAPRGPR